MSSGTSSRYLKGQRTRLRKSIREAIDQAKQLISEYHESEETVKQIKDVTISRQKLKANLNNYNEITSKIASELSKQTLSEQEQKQIEDEGTTDFDFVQDIQECVFELDYWLESEVTIATTPHNLTASEDTSFKEFMDKTSQIMLQTSQVIKDLKTSHEKNDNPYRKGCRAIWLSPTKYNC